MSTRRVWAALLWATAAVPGTAAEFIPIGDLPGGEFFSQATAISADGNVLVGESDSGAGRQAFTWNATDGMLALGALPGGRYSTGSAVSSNGAVVVGASARGNRVEAFRWTQSTGMVGLGSLGRGSNASHATDV